MKSRPKSSGLPKPEPGKPLIPGPDVQSIMQPITRQQFERIVERAATPNAPKPSPKSNGK